MNTFKKTTVLGLAGAAALISLTPAMASARDDDVRTSGSCSGRSTWKMKAQSEDNNKLEAELEVDSNVNGQRWNIVLRNNGVVVWRGSRTTVAPSGSFSVSRLIANRAGSDTITGRATNPVTGEVCRGRVVYPG